jgi:hypothetical protein
MSTISASTTTTTAYVVTADTTGTLVLQTGASPTTALTIDTSQNVGIGTASPTDKLTVSASVRFGATSSNRILYLGQSSPADNGAGSLEFQVSNTVKNWAIRTNNNVAGALEFCPSTTAGGTTYTTPSMLIDSSGNVGIGTTPNTKFEVNGQIRSSGSTAQALYLYGAAGVKPYIDINEYGVGDFYIGAGSTTSGVLSIGPTLASASGINVDRSGNVGVGTASPSTFGKVAVSVAGTTTPTSLTTVGPSSVNLYAATNGGSTDSTMGVFGWNATTGIGSGIGFSRENSSDWGTQLRFYTHPTSTSNIADITERMRIDSSGNVNIGSSTAPNTGSLSNRFLQLVANGYGSVGTAASNGVLTFTCNISANTATTFLYCADIDKWGGVILISYVRDADQNRSGMKMVRYSYNRTYTTLLDSSQNSGATFSVSANNLQVTIGGAGTYLTQFTIWGSAGP